jgi:hypothetical protein
MVFIYIEKEKKNWRKDKKKDVDLNSNYYLGSDWNI